MGGDGGVSEEGRGRIATPDRRVRVFVSSTLEELAQERRAARAAISGLRLTPVMFELGARPHPPRELYRAYLAQSDVFVGIYWQRYGWVAPGESVSGLEDEYLLSGDRPKLIYVKAPAVDREPRLTELLHRVQADDRASYKVFADAEELTSLLSDDLAVLLTERFTARHPEAPAGLRPARLPVPPTAMIGRDGDREELVARLRGDARLVTVTGPGGVGKTRLALDVAAALANGTAEGVWFVDLAPVPEPARVLGAIAAELGVQTPGRGRELDVLADRLAGRRVLLVLDNLEHLLPAAARDVARLLAMVSDLKVLATSRTVLHVRGEQEWPLRPLAVPEQDGDIRPQEAAVSPAVQLFLARAAESRPGFALTGENAAAVAEICRRLDGVPLAIELVAARIRVLPPAVLLERLGDRLDLGGDYADLPERQRTLRSTVDWSYRLLDAGERALLAWLSVFVGGWTVQAAEAVGAGTEPGRSHPDVMTTLSSLVDKSLVTVEDGGSAGPRFRMLGAVAEYAAERLDERGEREAAADRLVVFVGHLVEEAADGMRTAHRPWAARIDDELGNVRVAWQHTIDRDQAETAYRIFIPLAFYLWSRSLLPESVAFVDELVALPSASRLGEAAHGRLLWARAVTNLSVGRVDGVQPMLEEALRIGGRLGDLELVVRVSTGLAYLAGVDDAPEARQTLEKSVSQLRASGDLANTAYALATLAQLARRSGDLDRATAVFEECLRVAEQVDNEHLQTLVLHQLGFTALLAGKPIGAREYFQASVAANFNLLDQEGLAYCLDGFAAVARADGNPQAAVRLHAAAAHRRSVVGIAAWPELQPLLDAWAAAARSALEKSSFEQEWAAGARLRPADALAYAQDTTGVAR